MYKYSIIIPHKNSPELLERCIQSIPSREDVQIVVVDDNSDPEFVDFTNFPGNKRSDVITIFTKEGRGAGYARNVGINNASGQWALFADADDFYEEGFLEVLDKELDDEDVLFFNVKANVPDADCRGNKINIQYNKLFENAKERIRFTYWAPWNKVFNLKWVKDNSFQFDETPIVNDAFFCLTVSAQANRYKIINNPLYVLTDQPGSITYKARSFERGLLVLKQDLKINKLLKENGIKYVRAGTITIASIMQSIKRNGWRKTKKILNEVRQYNSIIKELLDALIYNLKYKY